MHFIRGVMLEGISCAGKTSTFNAIKKLHTEGTDSERSILALTEHYSQVLNRVDGKPVRLEKNAHSDLLSQRLSMLEQLNAWACSLGDARRQSRGLFTLLERFYLNHVVAFDAYSQSMENRCVNLGLKCVLLTISSEKIVDRIRSRDNQMHIQRPLGEVKSQASDHVLYQELLLSAAKRISIPSLIINTDSMHWNSYAKDILSFSDSV